MIRSLQNLGFSVFRPGQSSKHLTENEVRQQHSYFAGDHDLSNSGENGASDDEDDDGIGFLKSLLVFGEDDKRTSSQGLTEAGLVNLLTLFPDICPRYITSLYQPMLARKPENFEVALIDAILEKTPYTTQSDLRRRKLEDKVKGTHWGKEDNVVRNRQYWKCCKALLALDFPLVPADYIKRSLRSTKECLYNAYLRLCEIEPTYETEPNTNIVKVKREKAMASFRKRLAKYPFKAIELEIKDARAERKRRTVAQALRRQALEEENVNFAHYTAIGGLIECRCCYRDTPLNRTVSCSAAEAHTFCWECMRSNAKTQIGYMRHSLQCTDIDGCEAGFSQGDLLASIGESLTGKLLDLQQYDEIKKANLGDLEECPFCEYKAIYPPVEENYEFRCLKPECTRVSCRRCQQPSHIPMACKKSIDEDIAPLRKTVEEAMSKAVIRNCPNKKCRIPLIKESGCNKMTCSKCGTGMCYTCNKDITLEGHSHFSNDRGGCRSGIGVFDPYMHEKERRTARKKELEKIMRDNPGLREDDIGVELFTPWKTRDGYPVVYTDDVPNTSGLPRWPAYPLVETGGTRLRLKNPAQNEEVEVPGNYLLQCIERVAYWQEGSREGPSYWEIYAYAPYPLPLGLPAVRHAKRPEANRGTTTNQHGTQQPPAAPNGRAGDTAAVR
ncbi:ubiquitin conjugating enzyme 7 interacting protein 1 [Nannizzia gypsea CBS 118893]|uniref:Ubiquitin conjugating enzyme 7 interacting protein 1 n=1 Tax=Arthroderma gypseum (strain ATCC MYA-4604 / CBS 118893) TaxID=535722 RepID=E4UVU9_ARTGP|nr:ubiquitin conjugating enzyme 7 interacting protein 1 [Nannizzia gypsea CBS 118893]EFR02426.1 ubiquitin conjugating enzyme 7 interacting protein 1 [Nannizzia gypsea CBS 118893]